MENTADITSIQVFRDAIIGHLIKGFIHNVNSPLQIISMQLELMRIEFDKIQKLCPDDVNISGTVNSLQDRSNHIEDSLSTINSYLRILNQRKAAEMDDEEPVILGEVIKNYLKFWNFDLFLKHHVKIEQDIPRSMPIIVIKEAYVYDIVDGAMGLCLNRLKKAEEKTIKICLHKEQLNDLELVFEHSGEPFPPLESEEWTSEDKILFLPILKNAVEECGCDLEIGDKNLNVRISASK